MSLLVVFGACLALAWAVAGASAAFRSRRRRRAFTGRAVRR
jgi:hypothetical protein